MTLKDISFSNFFKIFFIVQAFILLLGCILAAVSYFVNPEAITFNTQKLFGIFTLDLSGTYNTPIMLFILGVVNVISSAFFYSCIAVIISKIPHIGRIKIGKFANVEQVFD